MNSVSRPTRAGRWMKRAGSAAGSSIQWAKTGAGFAGAGDNSLLSVDPAAAAAGRRRLAHEGPDDARVRYRDRRRAARGRLRKGPRPGAAEATRRANRHGRGRRGSPADVARAADRGRPFQCGGAGGAGRSRAWRSIVSQMTAPSSLPIFLGAACVRADARARGGRRGAFHRRPAAPGARDAVRHRYRSRCARTRSPRGRGAARGRAGQAGRRALPAAGRSHRGRAAPERAGRGRAGRRRGWRIGWRRDRAVPSCAGAAIHRRARPPGPGGRGERADPARRGRREPRGLRRRGTLARVRRGRAHRQRAGRRSARPDRLRARRAHRRPARCGHCRAFAAARRRGARARLPRAHPANRAGRRPERGRAASTHRLQRRTTGCSCPGSCSPTACTAAAARRR